MLIWDPKASNLLSALMPAGDAESVGAEVLILENQICARISFALFVYMAGSRLQSVFRSSYPLDFPDAYGPLSYLPRFPMDLFMRIRWL